MNTILSYTKFLNESEEKQYDVIESKFVYSMYCPVWFTGTEKDCILYIYHAQSEDPNLILELREKK